MGRRWLKGLTIAGLIGLAVTHPQAFQSLGRVTTGTFRKAAKLG